jgi:trimeric autotransporter adhesin
MINTRICHRLSFLGLCFLMTTSSALAQEYVISTYVGGSPPPTPAAALDMPIGPAGGMTADAFGDLYFVSRSCIFKMDLDGVVTLVAGGGRPGTSFDEGAATSAAISPFNVVLDGAGNLYIFEYNSNRIRKVSADGIIGIFAGNGVQGSAGDGGLALNASLAGPQAVAFDASGNAFIADTLNNKIRRVSPDGIITTVAGTGTQGFSGDRGPAIQAQLYLPTGVAFDGQGNLYISDYGNLRIREVSASGIITTIAGNGTAGNSGDGGPAVNAQLAAPEGFAVDSAGDVYVSNGASVRMITANGMITTVAGGAGPGYSGDGGPAITAQLSAVQLAVDGQGDLYISDENDNRIRKVTPDGIIKTVAGNGLGRFFAGDNGPAASALLFPGDVALDVFGNLFITDLNNLRVREVSGGIITTVAGTGWQGYAGDGGPAAYATLAYPDHLTADRAGNYYIADNTRVRMVSPSGVITTVAGTLKGGYSGDGGPAVAAEVSGIGGLAIDSSGNLYISSSNEGDCDPSFAVIRKVSTDGIISTVASVGGGAIAVDSQGNLYHGWGNVVNKIAPDGTVTIFAGNPALLGAISSGDGGPATAAGIRHVSALAVDSAGNVIIADGDNDVNNIRKVSPDGIITTIAGMNAPAGYSGDGGPATSAKLNTPSGLAIDSAGNIYVVDSGNLVVRVLQPVISR